MSLALRGTRRSLYASITTVSSAPSFSRYFHSSTPLFQDETLGNQNPATEAVSALENGATEQTIDDQMAEIKSQLDASNKEAGSCCLL